MSKTPKAREALIVALDTPSATVMDEYLAAFGGHVSTVKIGLEAITALGSSTCISKIHDAGMKVFYDGKFCDIPNTVSRAVSAAADQGADMLNVHASCGLASIEAAAKAKGSSKLWVVTVLTSISPETARHIFHQEIPDLVRKFARDARDAGADGVICSPKELEYLAQDTSLEKLDRVTPGVRPVWANVDDQKRVRTPKDAIEAGATAVVVGRPITSPPQDIGTPERAAELVLGEIQGALS